MFMNRKDKERLRLYRIALDWLHFQFSITDFVGMTVTFIENFKDSEKDKALLEVIKKGVRQFNTALREAEELPGRYAAQKRDHATHIERMIAEWRRGCPVADHHSPEKCETCTVGLVEAIENSVKVFAGIGAPETEPGAKLFHGFDERLMPVPAAKVTPPRDPNEALHDPAYADKLPPEVVAHPAAHVVLPLAEYEALRKAAASAPLRHVDASSGVRMTTVPLSHLEDLERCAADAAVPFYDRVTGLALEEGDVFVTSTKYWKALNADSERLTMVDVELDTAKHNLEIERDRVKRAEAESRSLLRVAFDASGFCVVSHHVLTRYAQFPWASQVSNIDALVEQLRLSIARQHGVLQPFYAVEAQKDVEDRIESTIDRSKEVYPS